MWYVDGLRQRLRATYQKGLDEPLGRLEQRARLPPAVLEGAALLGEGDGLVEAGARAEEGAQFIQGAIRVNRSIHVAPAPLDLDVGLSDMPRATRLASPPGLQLRTEQGSEALLPRRRCLVGEREAPGSDDYTFWYTQQYLATTGTFNWSTRIGAFRYPSCGGIPTSTPTNTPTNTATDTPMNTPTNVATVINTATGMATRQPTSTPNPTCTARMPGTRWRCMALLLIKSMTHASAGMTHAVSRSGRCAGPARQAAGGVSLYGHSCRWRGAPCPTPAPMRSFTWGRRDQRS